MIAINKEVLRFLVEHADWNTIMLEVVETQPETVAELLNGYFAPKTQEDPGESGFDLWTSSEGLMSRVEVAPSLLALGHRGLNKAFAFVTDAVNTKVDGRMTTNDKLSAIKELRGTFGLTLKEAKDAVELMMVRYEADPCYYPRAGFDDMDEHGHSASLKYTFN